MDDDLLIENLKIIDHQKDTFLIPENIKKDVTILGVTGNLTSLDTSDATAIAYDIIMPKTAYVNGVKITGSMMEGDSSSMAANSVTYENNYLKLKKSKIPTRTVVKASGYIQISAKASEVAPVIGVTAEKLKQGETILNVTGTYTSDATATANDIVTGKTAYVNGTKLTGTYAGITPSGSLTIAENGIYDITNYASITVNVPPLYQQLEYIQSSGTQYIDTGVSGGTNATYELWINPTTSSSSNWEQYFAGARVSTIPKIYQNTGDLKTQVGSGSETTIGTASNNLYKIIFQSDGKLIVNDVEKGTFSSAGWGNSTWYIFNSHGESTLLSTMRLYKLKMYEDGVLIRDFIPVKNLSNNQICLYDLVTRAFFTNAGSGNFIGGSPV